MLTIMMQCHYFHPHRYNLTKKIPLIFNNSEMKQIKREDIDLNNTIKQKIYTFLPLHKLAWQDFHSCTLKGKTPTCLPESKYISSLSQNFKIWNELPQCQLGQHCPDTFFSTRSISFAQLSNGGEQRFGSQTRKKNQMKKDEKMNLMDLPVLISLLLLPRQSRISSPQGFLLLLAATCSYG